MRAIRIVLSSLLVVCASASARAEEGFSLCIGGGMSAGGNLFRAISPEGTPQGGSYTTADGRRFDAAEFRTELSESALFSLRTRFPLQRSISMSLGLSFTDMDVLANARSVADNVDEILYDQVFVMGADLSVEYDWLPQGSRPFVMLGLGSLRMDFEERSGAESLDQTLLGLFAGGGFRVRDFGMFDLDIFARAARLAPDFAAERNRLSAAESFESEDAIWTWQLGLSWAYVF